ncbi:unnamed protein product [Clonostachys chloroleuca]|uniref:Uncharacterized protein n=1 Tax=Clonostachys chloroleuca TaxID=1926264 RepID=A0AA35MK93_9HYPO|nr:unnamed protein product [Clonostachys chloroleuca]
MRRTYAQDKSTVNNTLDWWKVFNRFHNLEEVGLRANITSISSDSNISSVVLFQQLLNLRPRTTASTQCDDILGSIFDQPICKRQTDTTTSSCDQSNNNLTHVVTRSEFSQTTWEVRGGNECHRADRLNDVAIEKSHKIREHLLQLLWPILVKFTQVDTTEFPLRLSTSSSEDSSPQMLGKDNTCLTNCTCGSMYENSFILSQTTDAKKGKDGN